MVYRSVVECSMVHRGMVDCRLLFRSLSRIARLCLSANQLLHQKKSAPPLLNKCALQLRNKFQALLVLNPMSASPGQFLALGLVLALDLVLVLPPAQALVPTLPPSPVPCLSWANFDWMWCHMKTRERPYFKKPM